MTGSQDCTLVRVAPLQTTVVLGSQYALIAIVFSSRLNNNKCGGFGSLLG